MGFMGFIGFYRVYRANAACQDGAAAAAPPPAAPKTRQAEAGFLHGGIQTLNPKP